MRDGLRIYGLVMSIIFLHIFLLEKDPERESENGATDQRNENDG